MAKQLTSTFYVSGGYLDSNSVVSSINELLTKEGGFNGQVVHMPKAFKGDNKYKLSYPVDFWKIPNGDGVKWEIKDIPALEKESDFDNFKTFIEDFKTQAGYLPVSENFEVVVEGKKMTTFFKDGELNWYDSSDYIDDLVADATQLAIDTVTSGASEAFDTLKEIEEWIKTNSGKTADLTGYATEAWVKEQNYLTEHQDLSGYAKKEELPSLDGYATESWVSAEIAKAQLEGEDVDLSGYATKDDIKDFVTSGWVENQGFLTEHQDITGKQDVIEDLESIREGAAKGATALQEVPEGYATETWVGEQGFLTEHQSLEGLATEQFVTDRISEIEIPSVEGLASEAWVKEQNYLTEHQDITGKQDVIEDLETIREGAAKGSTALQEVPEGYATETWVSAEIAKAQLEGEDVDLSGYATKDDIKGLATEQFVTDRISEIEIPSVEGLASEAWVGEQGFLTEHQDITGKQDVIEDLETIREGAAKGATALQEIPEEYVTNEELEAKGYLTEHQDISGLATKEDIVNFATKDELPSVEGLASEAWVGEQGFLTEHQDISGLATKEELSVVSGSIKTVIEDLLIPENAKESLDTLEEISAWIQSHPENAASMNEQIIALQESAHTHENKGVLDGITAEKVAVWDAAEANAKGYTDDEITKLSGIYAKKTDIEGLATETWVSAEIAKAQLEGEDVDLSGYATKDDLNSLATKEETEAVKTWVGEQGFLTEHQDITGKQDVIEDLETIREGAAKGATALQEVPEGYATETWVGEQGFLTEHQSLEGLATKEDIANFATKDELPSVEGLASEDWVKEQNYLTEHQDITGKQDVIEDLETIREGAAKGATALQEIPEEYVTNEELEAKGYLTEHQSLEGYATKEDIADFATKDELAIVSASVKTVVEELLIPESAKESLDTIEEISAWIQSHPDDAAAMNVQIASLSADSHTHANKNVLDGITEEKVAAWDGAESTAKAYADGLAANYDAVGAAASAETAAKAYVDEKVDGKFDEIGAAASAETAAKAYADGLVENLKPYDGGTGVDVSEYTVNVNVAEEGFLEVNDNNELTVTGVTLDAAVTSKDITIEGGKWADAVKTVFTGGTVPAGTTWQSFLESMLCVENFDTSYSLSQTFTVSCGSIGNGISGATNNSSVEVGTKVSLKSFSANPTSASQSYTVSKFDYGYKLGLNGTYNSSTSYTYSSLTPTLKSSNDALTATFTNFADENGDVISNISTNTSISTVDMRVKDGSNKVVIAQTGDTYTSEAYTGETIYVATNLKNYYKSDKKTDNIFTPVVSSTTKTATASTTYSVTGYRNTFYGTTSAADASDATFIRTLNKSNKAIAANDTISFDTKSSDGHLRMVIASPRTIISVANERGTQDLTSILVGTKKTVQVGGVDNFSPIDYNVYDYTWKGAFGNETWIITFA